MTVDDECNFSAEFLDALRNLANRLVEHDLAIYEVSYHYFAFGSWTLVAGTRHRRLRFQFDGKEDHLDIAQSAFSDSQSPPQWEVLPSPTLYSGVGVNVRELFSVVERTVLDTLDAQ